MDFVVAPKWRHSTLRAVHGYRHTNFGENIWNSGWVTAAILDFDTGQKWRHATLRTVHVYQQAKFGGNISNGVRVITNFRFSKWRPAAILDFVVAQKWRTARCGLSMATSIPILVTISQIAAELWRFSFSAGQKWRYVTLRTVNVYHHANLCNCTSTGGWDMAFGGKIQNGSVRHFEFLFGNSGPHTKFSYGPEVAQKIWCQSNFYFSRYRDLKILKIWLKTPIQAPKIYVFGGFYP